MAGTMTSKLVAGLRRMVHDLDPDCLDARDAAVLLELYAEGERLCAAAKTLLIKRIDEAKLWKFEGHPSAADYLARTTGVGINEARSTLDTARRLSDLSRTEGELRAGHLSEQQAREVTQAAIADPGAERDLLECATTDTLTGLKRHAERVKANARSAEAQAARHERIHRNRSWRAWTDADGAACRQLRTTPEAAQRIDAALDAEVQRIFNEARAEGRRERHDAYLADALLTIAEHSLNGDPSGRASKPAKAYHGILHLDVAALLRGSTQPGERCEIAGIGPVAVPAMRRLLPDAVIDLVIRDGVDVRNVTRLTRRPSAAMRIALEAMFTECGVYGCHRARGLEDHHTVHYAESHHTRVDDLVPLCEHDHDLHHHKGHTLKRRPYGQYDLIPPGDPANNDDERGPP